MMKIVLQNRVSWRYYGDAGAWVEDIEQAHCFASSMEALSFAQKQKLRDVQIVFKFPKERYDFTVLVRDAGAPETPRTSI